MDRLAPARRSPGKPLGFQNWRSFLFLHWEVPVDQLRACVPDSLSLDLYEGKALMGVVPFVMRDIRPHWWPAFAAINFLETNVRTYVHCGGEPGVYFMSLDANSHLGVWGGRMGWGLPYHFAKMKFTAGEHQHMYQVQRARQPATFPTRYQIGDPLGPSQLDTLQHFLLERYLLFVERQGQVWRGQGHHRPYPVQKVEVTEVSDSLIQAAGIEPIDADPVCAHYSPGVDVEIMDLRRAGT